MNKPEKSVKEVSHSFKLLYLECKISAEKWQTSGHFWSTWGINRSRPSVCVCVCQRSHDLTVGPKDPIFGTGMYLDNISDEVDGQSHMSKVEVTRSKNVISGSLTWAFGVCNHSPL